MERVAEFSLLSSIFAYAGPNLAQALKKGWGTHPIAICDLPASSQSEFFQIFDYSENNMIAFSVSRTR